ADLQRRRHGREHGCCSPGVGPLVSGPTGERGNGHSARSGRARRSFLVEMSDRSVRNRLCWTTAIVVILLDQLSKEWAVRSLMPTHIPHEIWGDVLRFTLAYNRGAAFSMSVGDHS